MVVEHSLLDGDLHVRYSVQFVTFKQTLVMKGHVSD